MPKNFLSVTFQGEFIKVIADGERDFEFISRVWTEALEAGEKHHCFKILGIANTTKPVQPIDFVMVAHEKNTEFTALSKYRIAWVESNSEAAESAYFMETYLRNRGFDGRLFSDVAKAEQWLLDNEG